VGSPLARARLFGPYTLKRVFGQTDRQTDAEVYTIQTDRRTGLYVFGRSIPFRQTDAVVYTIQGLSL